MIDVTDVAEYMGIGKSPRTAYLYARIMQRVIPLLEERDTDLGSCSGADVAMVAEHWPRSHASQGQLRAALGAAWALLERDSTPWRAVRVPVRPDAVCLALGTSPAAALERRAWDRADRPGLAVLVGLYAALRRAEVARLRWDAFRRIDGELWVRVTGKGDRTADIPVHPVLERALERVGPHGEWIFPGRWNDGPVHPNTVWDWTQKIAREAGLDAVATHRLRHTSLAEMNDRSGDLRAVQSIARHRRPETTAGYTRTRAARMRAVVEMIDYGRQLEGAAS